ncbi:MAG: 2,3-bisphosphoglycerate-independent phosphoglycerate mutase [Patescibacteria group bacterium]
MTKPIVLIILDGWGINLKEQGNAIASAKTPFIDGVEKFYPFLTLNSSGLSVGLPWGETGNSEVGHMTIGTGRITYQYLPRIVFSIQDGSFFKNTTLLETARHVKKHNSRLHIMGLTSSGTVHSYIDHLYALFEFAKREKISNVFLHIFTDGKDSFSHEAKTLIFNLKERMEKLNLGKIATVMGRQFAMDRGNNWHFTEIAYRSLTVKKTETTKDIIKFIETQYDKKYDDQNLPPIVLENAENTRIMENDAVIFFNFREDSVRQLTRAFVDENFQEFKRSKINNLFFATMTKYEENLPIHTMFEPPKITNSLSEILSKNGQKQFKVTETEKYAHITYFFNGLKEKPIHNEKRLIIPSLPATQYENQPEMKTQEITDELLLALAQNSYNFLLTNFANADTVGHSGNLKNAIQAIEFIDTMLKKLYEFIIKKNGVMIITSDHGNAEQMINPLTGNIDTEHNANPVPLYLIASDLKRKTANDIAMIKTNVQGFLSDIAPTILDIMNIEQPEEMTGKSLLERLNIKL